MSAVLEGMTPVQRAHRRSVVFVRWLRKIHLWVGLWGAALVFDVTAGRTAGLTAGGILLAVLLVLLVLVPLRLNRRARVR
jgi:hypothetical protein